MNLTTGSLKITPTVEPADAPAPDPCPKCGKALVDPTGVGWCPGCGYCKSLASDDTAKLLETKKRGPALGSLGAAGGAVIGMPLWFWGCFVFAAAGVGFGYVMDLRLTNSDSFERALWATLMIASGVLAIFLAQIFALVNIAPDESTLSFKDAVVPFRLWGLVFKRLPRCKECLWFALLGGSLMVGGAVCVGGLSHWLTYLPKTQVEREKERSSISGGGSAIVLPE